MSNLVFGFLFLWLRLGLCCTHGLHSSYGGAGLVAPKHVGS